MTLTNLLVNMPADGETEEERQQRAHLPDKDETEYVPRTFKIEKKDVVKYKQTPHCMGCHHAMNNSRPRPHTPACRDRIRDLMEKDPVDAVRILAARAREDAYLEMKIRQHDQQHHRDAQHEDAQ